LGHGKHGPKHRLCVLCVDNALARNYALILTPAPRAGLGNRLKLLILEDSAQHHPQPTDGASRIHLTGEFTQDVLTLIKELSQCRKVKVHVSDTSPYGAAVAVTAATIMYDKVRELSIECRLTPQEVCVANAALPHALSGREGRALRLKILAQVAGKCVTIAELSEALNISPETTLRHAYALSSAGLITVRAGDGNPVICGEISEAVATLAATTLKTLLNQERI